MCYPVLVCFSGEYKQTKMPHMYSANEEKWLYARGHPTLAVHQWLPRILGTQQPTSQQKRRHLPPILQMDYRRQFPHQPGQRTQPHQTNPARPYEMVLADRTCRRNRPRPCLRPAIYRRNLTQQTLPAYRSKPRTRRGLAKVR